ncbi:CBS domain-containing protein [Alicyclobacillaceae bacterium I2511]|nr:CBS domain-containing protein [Alicyclobacillaceae bacterium I2511]
MQTVLSVLGVKAIELSNRQQTIVEIVKRHGPITGEKIAELVSLTRATLRPDLSLLTMAGFLEARPRVGYFYSGKQNTDLLGEAVRHLPLRDYKSVPVVVSDTVSVYDAIVTMFMEDVGTLAVVRESLLQGIVSRKDLLKVAIGGGETRQIPVNVAMTRMPHVITVAQDATLYEAALLLVRHQVDSLPVVIQQSEGGLEVVGRVSKTTIVRAFVELGSHHDV